MWSRKRLMNSSERHRTVSRPPVAPVVLVAEGHAASVEADQPAVRDRDAMGVASEIGEHCLGAGEGRLRVDEPVFLAEWREVRGEGRPTTQAVKFAEERQPTRRMGIGKPGQEEPPEQAGQHPHRQQETGSAAYPAHTVE
jgi:hypothetical protein